MGKHTSGPWEIIAPGSGSGDQRGDRLIRSVATQEHVCETYQYREKGADDEETALANAQLIVTAPDMLETITARDTEIEDLKRELLECSATEEGLRNWIRDCQAGMYINCVYCGHRYGPDDEHAATLVEDGATPSMQEALRAHIAECPDHPMSALRTEIEKLRAFYDEAGVKWEDLNVLDGLQDRIEQLKTKNDHLRKALAGIAGLKYQGERDECSTIARTALDGKPDA
jgi:hypothetical protein